MKRVQRVEDSLAQSGAAAVRLPHLAPAFSPRKALQGQCARAKAHKGCAASPVLPYPVPRSSFLVSPVTPSGSPQINAQTRSEPAKADNRTNAARTHEWRSRPGGIETQATASRSVWRKAANSRREPRAKRRDRNAPPNANQGKAPRQNRKANRARGQQFRIAPPFPRPFPRAHNRLCRG